MDVQWSAEVRPNHWVRVRLEEADLARLFVEGGIDLVALSLVSVPTAYRLLDTECQRVMLAKLISEYGYGDESRAKLVELTERRNTILVELRAKWPEGSRGVPV